jgi:hypothetical protein
MIRIHDKGLPLPRYVTREKAIVMDTRDPKQSGRILVQSHFTGIAPVWIPYIMSPGLFSPPKVGDTIYIECENGDSTFIFAHGKQFSPSIEITSSLFRDVPTASAWMSNGALTAQGLPVNSAGVNGFAGHAIILDDGQQTFGGPSTNIGSGIKILSHGGNKIILDDQNKQITIFDTNGNSGTFNSSGITINSASVVNITAATNVNIMGSNVNITASGNVVVNATEVDVTAPNVNVISSAMVAMTTPILEVTGLITCSGIAAGGATPVAGQAIINGPVTATGNVSSTGGNISDSVGTLSGFRAHYNAHMHPVTTAPGETGTPTPTDP